MVLKSSDRLMPRLAFNILTQTKILDCIWTDVYKCYRKKVFELYINQHEEFIDREWVHQDLVKHVYVTSRGDIGFMFESHEELMAFKQKWDTKHPERSRWLSRYIEVI